MGRCLLDGIKVSSHLLFFSRLPGNHESETMNQMYGFFGEVKSKYNQQMAELFTEVYNWLPLAHLINKKVLVSLYFIQNTNFKDLTLNCENVTHPEKFTFTATFVPGCKISMFPFIKLAEKHDVQEMDNGCERVKGDKLAFPMWTVIICRTHSSADRHVCYKVQDGV